MYYILVFNLHYVFSPFSVSPRKAVLNINDVIHIQLSFESDIAGDFSRSMVIRYETGNEWFILKSHIFTQINMVNTWLTQYYWTDTDNA